MMRTRILLALLALLLWAGKAQAQTYTLGFDTDASGRPILEGTTIAEQYAAWGAHFVPNVLGGNNYSGTPFATNTGMTATATDFDPSFPAGADPSELPSGNVLHSLTDYFNADGDPNFWIAFDKPVVDVSLDTYYGFGSALFYGLDADLNYVSGEVYTFSPSGYSAHVTLDSNDPIQYLVVTGDTDFYSYDLWTGYDNVRFTIAPATVPEPGSLALLWGVGVTGAGTLLLRRHRYVSTEKSSKAK